MEQSVPNQDTSGKNFSIDARAMLTWGRDSIKDHSTAVLELVKNAYDAGATSVEVSISSGSSADAVLRIADNGSGMSDQDVSNKWLRIGYSEKRNEKKINGRRKVGEKGVGRISADRLGEVLELRSQAEGETAVGLEVDWTRFEQSGVNLNDIKLKTLDTPRFLIPAPALYDKKSNQYVLPYPKMENGPASTGTELIIRRLRQRWSAQDVENLYNELSVLTSPVKGVGDFQVRLMNDLLPSRNGVVVSPFYSAAHIEAEFRFDGVSVSYNFRNRNEKGKLEVGEAGSIPFENFVHLPSVEDTMAMDELAKLLGPVEIHLLFYLREADSIKGTKLTVADLREFLNLQAGIKVYRDNVRVMPYGDPRKPEGDWLGLGQRKAVEPAGPGRPSWKVAPSQLIGHVFLSRDMNPSISDTSGREGLIHGEAFVVLKALIFGCLTRLEHHYHKLFIERLRHEPPSPSPRETIRAFSAELVSLREGLQVVERDIPSSSSKAALRLKTQLSETIAKVSAMRRSMETLATQATIYRGLATLGIAVATFGHEIEAALEQFLSSANTAVTLMADAKHLDDAIDELEKSIHAGERIGAWGEYALRRVQSNKRKLADVELHLLFGRLLDELRPAFSASSIELVAFIEPVVARTFAMDIESIIVNLLTNAYFFSKLSKGRRRVEVYLSQMKYAGEDGFGIAVADSGPGVDPSILTTIWEPLFSTKVDRDGRPLGTGLGLSIIDAAVKDIGGTRSVSKDGVLGGARFSVWLRAS